jgi:hypothetical protein
LSERRALPISDLIRDRRKVLFLAIFIAGIAVMMFTLAMAFTVRPINTLDLYSLESAGMSVGIVMLCLGIILMKSGDEVLGINISDMEKQRAHDDMHDQVMAEMRLSAKDLEIQKTVQASDDELFK